MTRKRIKTLCLGGLFIAIGFVLPFITGGIPQVGNALLPMHLPVLLCGVICGPRLGALVGFVTPLLRSAVFGMPPLFPTAIAMAFELATYAVVIGIVYEMLKGRKLQIILALLASMVAGRIVWGTVTLLLLGISGEVFTFEMFLGGALLSAIPGILLQLLLVPFIIITLRASNIIDSKAVECAG